MRHLRARPAGHRERHSPAVGVEHRQRVQVDVAVGDAGVQREGDRVGPDVAVGDLHALGSGGGARGVVDRRGRVLLALPRLRVLALEVHVVVVAEDEHVLGLDALQRVLELGVDVEDPRSGVLDDVVHLVGREPEVDRHQHPAVAGDAEEGGEQPGAVVRDVGDPVTDADAELVELGSLGPGELAHAGVGQVTERRRRLVGLVDDADAVGVHRQGTVQEVGGRERHDHGSDSPHFAVTATLVPHEDQERGRSSHPIAGLASTPCTTTESPMVNPTVAHSHGSSSNSACPAA